MPTGSPSRCAPARPSSPGTSGAARPAAGLGGRHLDVARLLVVLGADPDAQDDQQDSAWLVTGVTGSVAMLEMLLPADPDLALRNRFGGVSVIPASERGHVDYVRRVVGTGIDVNHVNDPGWTACSRRSSTATDRSPTRRSSTSCSMPAPTRGSPTRRDHAVPARQDPGSRLSPSRLQAAGG